MKCFIPLLGIFLFISIPSNAMESSILTRISSTATQAPSSSATENDNSCPICYDPLKDNVCTFHANEQVPHTFHARCIIGWHQKQSGKFTCPIDRTIIKTEEFKKQINCLAKNSPHLCLFCYENLENSDAVKCKYKNTAHRYHQHCLEELLSLNPQKRMCPYDDTQFKDPLKKPSFQKLSKGASIELGTSIFLSGMIRGSSMYLILQPLLSPGPSNALQAALIDNNLEQLYHLYYLSITVGLNEKIYDQLEVLNTKIDKDYSARIQYKNAYDIFYKIYQKRQLPRLKKHIMSYSYWAGLTTGLFFTGKIVQKILNKGTDTLLTTLQDLLSKK